MDTWLAAQKKIKPPSAVEMEQAKLRKVRANALSAELIAAEQSGLLLRRDDVTKAWVDIILAFRSKLMSFPGRVARLVLGKEDLKEVMQILRTEIETTMADLREIPVGQYRTRKSKNLVADQARAIVEEE